MAHTGTPIQFTTLQTPAPTICSGCKENMDHQNPSSSNDESSSSPPLSYRPIRAPALNIPNRTSAQTAIMLTPVPQPQFVPTIYSSSDAEDGSAPHAHVFIAPSKRITSPNDIDKFLSPPSSGDNFLGFIASLSHSVLRKKISDPLPVPLSPTLESLLDLLQKLSLWVDEIPPVLHQARYGNPAFRDWFQRLAVEGKLLAIQILPEDLRLSAIVEVFPYLLDSFGNCTRIDYGTGHETNFAAFLYCLVRIGLIKEEDYQGLVLKVFVCYLNLMRKLQNVYSLEPAGSHGVWGLDDYHFLPFVFGSAQLVDHKYMKPKSIHNPDILDNFSKEYMYLECVLFVKSVKKGLFAEHSPLLDDISGVQKWSKVHGGMLKMYKAEVLQKVPIMQHFLFGSLIKW